jgi:hypothetical protein
MLAQSATLIGVDLLDLEKVFQRISLDLARRSERARSMGD